MPKERYCAKTVFASPAYRQGVTAGGSGTTLCASGQVARDARGNMASPALVHPDDMLEAECIAFVEGR